MIFALALCKAIELHQFLFKNLRSEKPSTSRVERSEYVATVVENVNVGNHARPDVTPIAESE